MFPFAILQPDPFRRQPLLHEELVTLHGGVSAKNMLAILVNA